MKLYCLFFAACACLVAQSIAVTSPANGAVVTTQFPLTVVPTSLPAMTQAKVYVDARLECVIDGLYLGKWQCPKMYNATASDERAAWIYAEAYDAKGTLLATSATNTFRIDNNGLNSSATFSDMTGAIARNATTSGTLTMDTEINPGTTVANLAPVLNVDGVQAITPASMYSPAATIDAVNGIFTVPIITAPSGASVSFTCGYADGSPAAGCTFGTLAVSTYYVLIVHAANQIQFAATGTPNTPITGLTVSTPAGAYVGINVSSAPWESGNSGQFGVKTFNTKYFLDGVHRIETLVQGAAGNTTQGLTGTLSFNASAISGNIATSTDYPLAQGQAATCAGTCPTAWTGITLYTVVETANTFCFASSAALAAAGTCLEGSGGSGTLTISFTVLHPYWSSGFGGSLYGTDINEFTFANGAVPCVLRAKYSKIAGIAGDSFTLAPYILNCDGSTTALTASALIYSSNDAARCTVSSVGVVTLQSATGHCIISVVDNAHSRSTLIDGEVRPDRTTFKHLSKCGLIANYNPACSVPALVPFGSGQILQLTNYPFAAKYVRPAFTALGGLFLAGDLMQSQWTASGWTTFGSWYSAWTGPASNYHSLAYAQSQNALAGGMLSYGTATSIAPGYPPYRLSLDVPKQQAFAQMLNDTSGFTIGLRACDEINACWGYVSHPRGDIGSGQNGIGGTTIGSHAAGLTSLVTAGGVTTVNLVSWTFIYNNGTTLNNLQITGATSANCKNLNGPYTGLAGNTVLGHDDPRGTYVISWQMPSIGVPDGTCNAATDPGLTITSKSSYAAWTFNTIPAAIGWAAFASPFMQCGAPAGQPSNTCILHGSPFPIPSDNVGGTILQLSGFTTPGLNGYWRLDHIDANTSSFTVKSSPGVADGTYSASNNGGVTFNGWTNQQDSWNNNFFQVWSTALASGGTGLKVPMSGGQQAGAVQGPLWAGWYNGQSATDFEEQNATFYGYDRYGNLSRAARDIFRPRLSMSDGALDINLLPTDKPILYQTAAPGGECDKYVTTNDCRTDAPGGDLLNANNAIAATGGKAFVMNIIPWIMPDGVGSIVYQYQQAVGFQRAPPACTPTAHCVNVQVGINEVDQSPEDWLAVVSVNMAVQKEAQCLLSPLLSSPDFNIGPGPGTVPQIEAQSHTGTWGSCILMVNLSEDPVTFTADYSLFPNAGGPMRRWNLGAFGDTITSLTPGTASESLTLRHAEAALVISQAAGSADGLQTINVPLTPAYGATGAVLEIHYDTHDKLWQSVDCGTGACPAVKVNLHGGLDVYTRHRFLNSDGSLAATGDLERLPAQ